MRTWSVLTAIGFALIAAILALFPDLRGWTPADHDNRATIVEPTRSGAPPFSIAECVPGTINAYGTPTAEEYSGSATVTVLSCRSRSSAVAIMLAYIAAAVTALIVGRAIRRRLGRGGDKRG